MSGPLMPIDIRQITTGQTSADTKRANGSADKVPSVTKSEQKTSTNDGDSVVLSDKAQLVQSLISDLSSKPVVNQSRVEQLRNAIASGEFSVSADKIADKMLNLDAGLRKLSDG